MIKKALLLFLALVLSIQVIAQQNIDFQGRFTPSIQYNLNKNWKFTFDYRLSLENDWQKFRSSAFFIETKYSITKKLKASSEYGFFTSFEQDAHRFSLALSYDFKLSKQFTLTPATKFQYVTNSFDKDFINEYKASRQITRQELTLDYNVPKSKFSFNGSVEAFFKSEREDPFKYVGMRYSLGTTYNFKKYGKLGIGIFYDDDYNPTKDDRIVFVTKYSLSINDLIKVAKKAKMKREDNILHF